MSDSGPTTAGSIVGRLKIDSSAWTAELDKAELKADELGRKNPTIEVKSDVAEAITKLDAVSSASDRVGRAQLRLSNAERAAANSASTAYIANERLAAVMDKRGRTELQVAAATEAAARADRNAEAAELRHLAAIEALNVAQRNAAASALEEGAAQETAAKSGGLNVSRMGLIVAAVALLVPLMGPLLGYTAGVAGALGAMGSAGVLAILGIRDAMKQGTAEGDTYRSGLNLLKGDLDQLTHTAAAGMLNSFQTAVSNINDAMPSLNTQIGQFTRLLGATGNNVLATVISGLKTLNPLFLTAGAYVERLSAGILSWTQNGGLQKFTQIALASFPTVVDTLGSIVRLAASLVIALGPLSGAMFGTLTVVANLASLLLGALNPALVAIGGAALAVWGGFKLWGMIEPTVIGAAKAVAAFSAELWIAVGPLGVAAIAVGLLAVAIAGMGAVTQAQIAFQKESALATQDYTAAIIADTGAVGVNTMAHLAKALADSGALDAAHKLGVSTETYTQAILGNAAAIKIVDAATKGQALGSKGLDGELKRTGLTLDQLTIAQLTAADGVTTNSKKIKEGIDYYKIYSGVTNVATDATKAQLSAQSALANQYGSSVPVFLSAQDSVQKTADALAQATQNMIQANDAGGLLKQTLDALNGKTMSAAQAQNQFDTQLANMSFHIDKTGNAVNRANSSLTNNTAAAAANRGEIIQLSAAAMANAEAYRANGASQDDTKAKMIDMKKSIVDQAVAHGENRDQVQTFIDTLFKIPDKIPATKIDIDDAVATLKLQNYIKLLASIPGYISGAGIQVGMNGGVTFSDAKASAYAAKIAGHASGGTIAGPGSSTSDSVPIWASVGEHMWTASEVMKVGGQGAMYGLRAAVNSGKPVTINGGSQAPTVIHNHTWNISEVSSVDAVVTGVMRRFTTAIA